MNRRFAVVWMVSFAAGIVLVAAAGWALHAALAPEEQAEAARLLRAAGDLPWLLVVLWGAGSGFLARFLFDAWLRPARRIAEATRVIATANAAHRVPVEGPSELRAVAGAVNALAARAASAIDEVEARVVRARADLDAEKRRLAALMSELAHSVVVCNADGRILLYNTAAVRLFEGSQSGAGGFLGLGRSLFTLIDRSLIVHGLEQLHARAARNESGGVTSFMAALGRGQLVRVRMALTGGADDGASLGFVLLLESAAEDVARAERRDRILHELIESTRAATASVRAAAENLIHFPEMAAERREQFTRIVRDEANRITAGLDRATHGYADLVRSQWSLEPMRGVDLLALVERRVAAIAGLSASGDAADPELWLAADSFALTHAMVSWVRRVNDACGVARFELGVAHAGRHARIEIGWVGQRLSTATVATWETEPMEAAGEASPLGLREVIERHKGEAWYETDRGGARSRYCILLPAAAADARHTAVAIASRPEFYDFDLFARAEGREALADRRLRDLVYTAFDTETTGLEPSAGDEIISIGAVRIVNGRMLAGEAYEQLVDPRRPLKAESVAVHGISAAMLAGQPTIDVVLPAFHRFAEDTVLVGHNAAFDMRFLQMKEATTGLRFDQPVLDTLLLSAALHQDLQSHRLEAIAERLGVAVVGRHTALGDAIVTAEVFLRLIPLLEARGMGTLGAALAAAQQTQQARLRY